MPRYALLIHDSPRGLHYDFFLECGDVLRTWALPRLPATQDEMECEALADHRLLYLDYEGPISGGRGSVVRCDSGTYDVEAWSANAVIVELAGGKLVGRAELRRLDEPSNRWRFTFHGTIRP